jgi:hypothetical protein
MAEGDAIVLNNLKEQLLKKTIDCVNDTFKIALYSVALASPDGADTAYSATNEIVASGYTAGGATLGSKTVTQDDTNNRAAWDAADVAWTSLAAATIVEARLYDDTTATKWVAILWEIATNSNGGNYTLAFNAAGIMTLS